MGRGLTNLTIAEMAVAIEARKFSTVEPTVAKINVGAPGTTAGALGVDAKARVAAAAKRSVFDLPGSIYEPLSEAAPFTLVMAGRLLSDRGFLGKPGGFFTFSCDVAQAPAVD